MMNSTRRIDRRDDRRNLDAFQAVEPVIRSAVGVIRESAGLFRNVAGLGFALVFDAKKAAPRPPVALPPVALPPNVIPFPTRPQANQKANRSRR
jgi:hypothetical protein